MCDFWSSNRKTFFTFFFHFLMANDDLRLLAKNIKRKKTQAIADLLRKLERSSNFCIWNSLYKVHGIESFDATILLQNPQCAKRLLAVLRDPQFNVFSNAIFLESPGICRIVTKDRSRMRDYRRS